MSEALEPRRLMAVGGAYSAPTDPRATLDLNAAWKFIRSDVANAQATTYNDSSWTGINVPHTWNAFDAQDGGNNYYRGIGWYRKTVTVPASMIGDTIKVRFDGSAIGTTFYLDGVKIGATHVGSFGAFDFDVTGQLTGGGSHVFAVKVDNSLSYDQIAGPESADFPQFGGIYRDMQLLGVSAQHVTVDDFASPGVKFSTPSVSRTSATTNLIVGLSNESASAKNLSIRSYVVDQSGTIVSEVITPRTLAAGEDASITQTSTIANPHLWNGTLDPYLHNLYVEVRDASSNSLIDFVKQRVGIRSYTFSSTQGFLLNGSVYPIHGVAMHQDRLNKGWAISDDDIRQDIGLVMEMGANAIRTAHYEQNDLTYDVADEKGLIVYTEVPNVSSNNGNIPTDAAFLASMQQQVKELIRQRFNHPSVIAWGVYNEVYNTAANRAIVQNLDALVNAEDPSRKSTGASNLGDFTDLERSTDIVAYNRYYGWYYGVPADFAYMLDQVHTNNPNAFIGITEYGAGGSAFQHQENAPQPTIAGPFHPEEYQATYHEQNYKILKARTWLWGTFLWNMFDFAVDFRNEGDTAGRNDKGLVTYDRQTKKDAFYYYKANWSADAVVHINSARWTDRTVAATKIKFYSNIPNAVLRLNGNVIGSIVSGGEMVYTSPTMNLQPGQNIVTLTGVRDGVTYTDTATWTLPGGTTLPAAATNLLANATSATTVTLSWNDNSNNETGFRIERRLGTTGAWGVLTTTVANISSFLDSTALANATYNYQVFAVNSGGSATQTNAASATTPAVVTVPNAPSGLAATATSATSVSLSWTDNGGNETGFRVERRDGTAGVWNVLTTLGVNATAYVDTTASANSTYNYQVFATNAAGASPQSNVASVATPTIATAPNAATALTAIASNPISVSLAWADNSSDETGFRIERRLGTNFDWIILTNTVANVNAYLDSTALASTTYVYQVFAFNDAGAAQQTNEATVTTPGNPTVPNAASGLSANATSSTTVALAWADNSSDETGFRIERRVGATGAWMVLTTTNSNALSFIDATAAASTTYSYQVFAINAVGASGASNAASVTMPAAPVTDDYTSVNIGAPALAGSTSVVTAGKDYDITAGGSDVWAAADQFRFVYKSLTGDFDYSARITNVSVGNSGSMAGLMARASLDANSAHIYSRATSAAKLLGNYRLTTGGASVGIAGATTTFPNTYVRLQRAGNVFTVYGSADGVSWTTITQQTIAMPTTIFFGMAVSARTTTATTTASIRGLTDRSTILTTPATPTNLQATPNTIAQSAALAWTDNATTETGYRVERRLASTSAWSTLASLSTNATSYTDTTAAFDTAYVYRVVALNSAGEAVSNEAAATVASPAPAAPIAPSALSASNVAGVAKIAWADNSANEVYFQVDRKLGSGAWSSIAIVAANTTSYSDSKAIAGGAYAYRVRALGIDADSAYSDEAALTVPASNVMISAAIGGTIGSTQVVTDGKEYDVTSNGGDVWLSEDQFRFVYRQVAGNFDMRVRIASLSQADVLSMAGLMARASLDANSRNVFVKEFADGRLRMTARNATAGSSVGIGGGTLPLAGFLRLTRVGDVFTGYASVDGVTWTLVSSIKSALPKNLYIGMAVASHLADSTTTTAQFRDFTLA